MPPSQLRMVFSPTPILSATVSWVKAAFLRKVTSSCAKAKSLGL